MSSFEKWLLRVTTAVTFVTGVAYMWMKYFLEPTEPWAAVNHPLEPWMLKAHIVAAPLLVFAVGLVSTHHIWKHFRAGVRAGRRSGLLALAVFAPMVLSGYLIQVVTSRPWLVALAWIHIVTGVAFVLGFVLHGDVFRGSSASPRRRELRRPSPGGRLDDEGTGPDPGTGDAAAPTPRPTPRNRPRSRRLSGDARSL